MESTEKLRKRKVFIVVLSIILFFSIIFGIYRSFVSPQALTSSTQILPIASSSAQNLKEEISIVAFGDSITAGYGLRENERQAYPALLETALREKGYSVQVINAGLTGDTTAGGVSRAPTTIDRLHPDIVILALGGNDMLRGIPPTETHKNLRSLITLFQADGIQVVLAGMKAPANLGREYVQEFNAIFPNLAKEFKIPLIPFLLDGVALKPELNQDDGIHPTAEGQKLIMEQNILPEVLSVL